MLSNQTITPVEKYAAPEKPLPCQSDSGLSGATVPTLGKRTTRDSFEEEQACDQPSCKRQRRTSPCRLTPGEDVIIGQDDANAQPNALSFKPAPREVKSAPNSNNGSTNQNPMLEAQFELPMSVLDHAPEEKDDSNSKKEKRLLQNRISAQKCRQKKKAQFSGLKEEFDAMAQENQALKKELCQMSQLLTQEMERNKTLTAQIQTTQDKVLENQRSQRAMALAIAKAISPDVGPDLGTVAQQTQAKQVPISTVPQYNSTSSRPALESLLSQTRGQSNILSAIAPGSQLFRPSAAVPLLNTAFTTLKKKSSDPSANQ